MVFRFFKKKEITKPVRKKSFSSYMGADVFSSGLTATSNHLLAKEAYQGNSVAFRCISVIADECVNVPLSVYRKKVIDGDYEYEKDISHPLNKLLLNPVAGTSGRTFLNDMFSHKVIYGNVYVANLFSGGTVAGEPIGWKVLRPDRMIINNARGFVTDYQYTVSDGASITYPVNPLSGESAIFHYKEFNPLDDYYGQSPLLSAMSQVDILNQSSVFNLSLLKNGAKLDIALKLEDFADDETRDNIYSQFVARSTGVDNASRPLLLENGLEIQELGIKPKDMEFQSSVDNASRQIALALGVPVVMIGLKDAQSTYNNMEEARLSFYQTTIKGHISGLFGDMDSGAEGEFNIYLSSFYGDDICIKPDWEKVDALAPVRIKRYERANLMIGVATLDERRDVINLGELGKDERQELLGASQEVPVPPLKAIKASESDVFNEIVDEQAKPFSKQVESELVSVSVASASLYADGKDIEKAIKSSSKNMLKIISSNYKKIIDDHAKRVFFSAEKADALQYSRKDIFDRFSVLIIDFIAQNAADAVVNIMGTTREAINRQILLGDSEGLTRDEISKNIVETTSGSISRNRANVIARTESASAANYAQKEASIAATGVNRVKWLTVNDSRTRDSHRATNGQIVSGNKKFTVGGHKAEYPADPSLPAKDRINCRCTTRIVFDEA